MKYLVRYAVFLRGTLGVGILSVLAACLVVEIYLRIGGHRPESHWLSLAEPQPSFSWAERMGLVAPKLHMKTAHGSRLRPNAHFVIENDIHTYSITTDANGCRRGSANSTGRVKVLVIGDSITAGMGLPVESTFPKRLEALASQRGINLVSVNCGVDGLGSEDEVWRLKEVIHEVNPSVVLLQTFLNDYQRSLDAPISDPPYYWNWSWMARSLYPKLSVFLWKLLSQPARFSPVDDLEFQSWRLEAEQRIAREASGLSLESAEALRTLVLGHFDAVGASWSDGAWLRLERHFADFKKISDERGAELAVVGFPIKFQVDHPEWDSFPQKRLKTALDRIDVPFLDLLPLMQRLTAVDGGAELYPPDDPVHPNARAHEVIALWLFDFLIRSFPRIQEIGGEERQVDSVPQQVMSKSPTSPVLPN